MIALVALALVGFALMATGQIMRMTTNREERTWDHYTHDHDRKPRQTISHRRARHEASQARFMRAAR